MNIEELLQSTMNSLKQVIDTSNIVGKPLNVSEGVMIVPVSKVTFGFLTGAGEYSESAPKVGDEMPHAGGSGGGASVTPIGFLVCYHSSQNFIKIDKVGDSKWAELIQAAVNVAKDFKD